jgi:hypothetical protein
LHWCCFEEEGIMGQGSWGHKEKGGDLGLCAATMRKESIKSVAAVVREYRGIRSWGGVYH